MTKYYSEEYGVIKSLTDISDIPPISSGIAGRALKINNLGTGYEWADAIVPDGRGKAIIHLEDGYGWSCIIDGNFINLEPQITEPETWLKLDQNVYDYYNRNTPTTVSTINYGEGKFNNALYFGQSSISYIYFSNNTVFNISSFSISLWVYVYGRSTINRGIFGTRNDTNNDFYFLLLQNSDAVEIRVRTSSGVYESIVDYSSYYGAWTNIVMQHNSISTEVWINGIMISKKDIGGFFSSNAAFCIGTEKINSSNSCRDLIIDQVRIYKKFLTPSEIAVLYSETEYVLSSTSDRMANYINTTCSGIVAEASGNSVLVRTTAHREISDYGSGTNTVVELLPREFSLESLTEVTKPTAGQYLRRNYSDTAYEWVPQTIQFFSSKFPLPIINGNAETGTTYGWVNELNIMGVRSGGADSTTYYFWGGQYSSTTAYQNITLISESYSTAALDNELCQLLIEYSVAGWPDDSDNVQVGCRFINNSGSVISSHDALAYDYDVWTKKSWAVDIPAYSRSVDIVLKFKRVSGTDNNGYIDEIKPYVVAPSMLLNDLTDVPISTPGKFLRRDEDNEAYEWAEVASKFIDLTDTPDIYSSGSYLRMAASGIQSVDGIILTAEDSSEWILKVTTSGVLYTEAM